MKIEIALPIFYWEIDGKNRIPVIDLKDLYIWCTKKAPYAEWARFHVKKLNLEKDVDFTYKRVKRRLSYVATLHAAIQICEHTRGQKGSQAHKYLIDRQTTL